MATITCCSGHSAACRCASVSAHGGWSAALRRHQRTSRTSGWASASMALATSVRGYTAHHHSYKQSISAIRQHLKRICGVDVTAIHGLGGVLAQEIVMETGTDLTKFPNEKHFCSWLGLAPKNEIAGARFCAVPRSRPATTPDRPFAKRLLQSYARIVSLASFVGG